MELPHKVPAYAALIGTSESEVNSLGGSELSMAMGLETDLTY